MFETPFSLTKPPGPDHTSSPSPLMHSKTCSILGAFVGILGVHAHQRLIVGRVLRDSREAQTVHKHAGLHTLDCDPARGHPQRLLHEPTTNHSYAMRPANWLHEKTQQALRISGEGSPKTILTTMNACSLRTCCLEPSLTHSPHQRRQHHQAWNQREHVSR